MLSLFSKRWLSLGTLALCLGVPHAASATTWEPVAKSANKNLTYYVDSDSLTRNGGIAYVWVDGVEYDYSGNLVSHIRSFTSIHCAKQVYRDREVYALENGQVVASEKLGDRAPLKTVVPGSVMSGIADYACGR